MWCSFEHYARIVSIPLLLGVGSAHATALVNTPGVRHFDTIDGLPSETVTALAWDDEHNELWIGTPHGLVRYDGSRMQAVPLPERRVQAIETIPFYGAIVGTPADAWSCSHAADGTIAREAWTPFEHPYLKAADDSLRRDVFTVAERPDDGSVWFGTGTGAKLYTVFEWIAVDSSDGLPTDTVTAIADLPPGASGRPESRRQVWMGTPRGLFEWFEPDTPVTQPARFPSHLRNGPITCLLANDVDATVWAGTPDGLYARHDAWRRVTGPGAPHGRVDAMALGVDGTLWVTAGASLHRSRDGRWAAWELPSRATTLVCDSHVLWIGTAGDGLYRWQWGSASDRPESRWPTGPVTAMGTNADRSVTLAAGPELWRVATDGTTERILRTDAWRSVNALLPLSDGSTWLATDTGVFRIAGNRITLALDETSMLGGAPAHSLALDAHGKLWIGAESGVFWLNPQTFRLVAWRRASEDGEQVNTIYPIAVTPDSVRWMGTPSGVLALAGSKTYALARIGDGPGAISLGAVTVGAIDPDGALWFGDDQGNVVRARAKRDTALPDTLTFDAHAFGAADGIWGAQIKAISVGPDSTVWVATGNGIHAMRRGIWAHYRTGDAAADPGIHAVAPLARRTVLVGTRAGLRVIRVDPDPPETQIVDLAARIASTGELVAAVAAWDPWNGTPDDKLHIQWRIDAGPWSTPVRALHVATNGGPPGEHVLEVRAIDGDLNADPTPAAASYTVDQPVWRSWWMISLLTVIAGIGIVQTIRLRATRRRIAAI